MGISKPGVPLKQGSQNSNFLTTHARHMKISGYANMKKKIKFDEIWEYQNEGIPLQQGRQNSKLNHSRWTDEIFSIGKYEKIKFDKTWEYHNGGPLQ